MTVTSLLLCAALLFFWPDRGVLGRTAPSKAGAGSTFNVRAKKKKTQLQLIDLISLLRQFSALLQGGRATQQVWRDLLLVTEVAALRPALGRAAALAELGLNPAPGLVALRHSTSPRSAEYQAVTHLVSSLELAERSGAPLALLLARLAEHLEKGLDARALCQTALAGPKATARLLSWLPLLGLMLGFLIGVDPISALSSSALGVLALLLGLGLMAAAWLWMSILVRSAEQRKN